MKHSTEILLLTAAAAVVTYLVARHMGLDPFGTKRLGVPPPKPDGSSPNVSKLSTNPFDYIPALKPAGK